MTTLLDRIEQRRREWGGATTLSIEEIDALLALARQIHGPGYKEGNDTVAAMLHMVTDTPPIPYVGQTVPEGWHDVAGQLEQFRQGCETADEGCGMLDRAADTIERLARKVEGIECYRRELFDAHAIIERLVRENEQNKEVARIERWTDLQATIASLQQENERLSLMVDVYNDTSKDQHTTIASLQEEKKALLLELTKARVEIQELQQCLDAEFPPLGRAPFIKRPKC